MTKVKGLFLDYDGTLSSLNVTRQMSRIPPHLEALLQVIRKHVPVTIITAKDLSFILPRTPFADAWGAIAGIELKIGSELFISHGVGDVLAFLTQSLKYAKRNVREGGVIEEKRGYTGQPLAFCVDWRQMRSEKEAQEMASQIADYCRNFPLSLVQYEGKPYFDVFPRSIDKGKTVKELKDKLGLSDSIIYMGDSITDNLAFQEADISIGVSEGKKPVDLLCKYWVKFEDVGFFLGNLHKNNLIFSPDLPGVKAM